MLTRFATLIVAAVAVAIALHSGSVLLVLAAGCGAFGIASFVQIPAPAWQPRRVRRVRSRYLTR